MFKNNKNIKNNQNEKNNPLFITYFQLRFEIFSAVMFYFMSLIIQNQTYNEFYYVFNPCALVCLMATLVMGYYIEEDSRVLSHYIY